MALKVVAIETSTPALRTLSQGTVANGFVLASYSDWTSFKQSLAAYAAQGIELLEIVADGTPSYCGIFLAQDPSLQALGDWINHNLPPTASVYLSGCNTGDGNEPTVSDYLANVCHSKVLGSLGYLAGFAADNSIEATNDDWGNDGAYIYQGSVPVLTLGSDCFALKAPAPIAEYVRETSIRHVYDLSSFSDRNAKLISDTIQSALLHPYSKYHPKYSGQHLNPRVGPDLKVSVKLNGAMPHIFEFLYNGKILRDVLSGDTFLTQVVAPLADELTKLWVPQRASNAMPPN